MEKSNSAPHKLKRKSVSLIKTLSNHNNNNKTMNLSIYMNLMLMAIRE
jgi:hypothetical protein